MVASQRADYAAGVVEEKLLLTKKLYNCCKNRPNEAATNATDHPFKSSWLVFDSQRQVRSFWFNIGGGRAHYAGVLTP